MHFKGMSDWSGVELEDINWDVFRRSDEHIVPYQGVELLVESSAPCDGQKRAHHELKDDVGKNMCSTGFSSKIARSGEETTHPQNASSILPEGSHSHTLHDLECIANTSALPPHNVRILDSCLSESNSIARSKLPFSNDPGLGTTVSINENKSYLSPFNGVSPYVNGLSFVENDRKARNNDLASYDWPDISNFEDIDKMFRNWDSTFGHDQSGTTDELSWFSASSSTIYGSEIAFAPGFQSPSSDLGFLHSKLESHCPNANFLTKNVPVTADHNRPPSANYADWLGTDASPKAKSVGKEKIESHHSLEEKRTKSSPDQMLLGSDASAPQIYSPKRFLQEKHIVVSSSSSFLTNLDPHNQVAFGLPMHQLPFTQITSSFEIEQGTNTSSSYTASDHVVNHPVQCVDRLPDQLYIHQATAGNGDLYDLYQGEQLCNRMAAEHSHQPVFQSKASVQKKLLETINDAEMEDPGLELPKVESAHPTAHEISCMASVSSDNISEKITSFQQLQDVMYQLDVRTKLCIRDSLYRLASSDNQRHGFTVQSSSKGATDTKGIQAAEASKRMLHVAVNILSSYCIS